MKKIFLFTILPVLFVFPSEAQMELNTSNYILSLTPNGEIRHYIHKDRTGNDTVSFRQDKFKGLAFDNITLKLKSKNKKKIVFESYASPIIYRLEYTDKDGILHARSTIINGSDQIFMPEKGVGLCLGIDTYMEKYPDWNRVYFPSMIRTERTHFMACFMTPQGKIFSVASPDPVASWRYNYEQSPENKNKKKIYWGAHRIYTVSIDMLHRLPLPVRHPQNLYALGAKEEKSVNLYFKMSRDLQSVNADFQTLTQAPVLNAKLYTLPEGEPFEGEIRADSLLRVEIRTPRNEVHSPSLQKTANNLYRWTYTPFSGAGQYTFTATTRNGKISEMILYVRPDFLFYLSQARNEALRSRPTPTHHAECFYPLYTYFLARKYVPEHRADSIAETVYQQIFPLLFDDKTKEMRNGKYRIQDAATMAGILADRYQLTQDEKDLENAAGLVDFLIRCQKEDGGYYNPEHRVHYTSVIYLAKSIMEVLEQEKQLIENPRWKQIYTRHKNSVTKALDDLERRGDDLETEGQMTFEDGMISCSVTQLAYAALKTDDSLRKHRYLKQAIALNEKHQCLTQFLVPDARMNGATLRFWEYQYTINLMHNGMNSPCGWSAWKIYGSWYLYLLTGEYKYIQHTLNALGSSLQLLDISTGRLSFSFIPDPYIETFQYLETPIRSRQPELQPVIVGEQYLPQISSWHKDTYPAWRKKWGIDNFVHEIFKCMTEIFVTNAYIIEQADGKIETVNCTVKRNGDTLLVETDNPKIEYIHINLTHAKDIQVVGNPKIFQNQKGCRWLNGQPHHLDKL